VTGLFDTTGFMPRAFCGAGWTPEKIWWDNFANLLIFWAYVAIPVVLFVMFARVRKVLPEPEKGSHGTDEWGRLVEIHPLRGFPSWVLVAFGVFILSCGIGHYWEVLVFRKPMYNLYIAWSVLTGVASWIALAGAWQTAKWLSRKFLVLWQTIDSTVTRLEAALESETVQRKAKHDMANELHVQKLQLEALVIRLQAELEQAKQDKEKKGSTDTWANAKHATLDRLLTNVLEITEDAARRRSDT